MKTIWKKPGIYAFGLVATVLLLLSHQAYALDALSTIVPSPVITTPLGEEKVTATDTIHAIMKSLTGTTEMPKLGIIPLTLAGTVLLRNGSINPVIEAKSKEPVVEYEIRGKKTYLTASWKLMFQSAPSAGEATDVADTIRLDPGVGSFNGSGRYVIYFSENYGFDVRGGINVSYQSAQFTSSDKSSATAEISKTDFGIVTPELTAGAYLGSIYLGYKWRYYSTFGGDNNNEVAKDVDSSVSHTVVAIVSFAEDSKDDSKKVSGPYFLELRYTKSPGSGDAFSAAITKAFSAP